MLHERVAIYKISNFENLSVFKNSGTLMPFIPDKAIILALENPVKLYKIRFG